MSATTSNAATPGAAATATSDAGADLSPTPIPPLSQLWLDRDVEALAGVLPRITDLVIERGQGSWVTDVDGRRFLDFSSGIAVTNVGHCHPTVVAAVERQVRELMHVSVVAHHTRSIELAERLGRHTPFFSAPQFFFCNSGAEAVDGSIKLTRLVTGRPGVIAFRRAFHGRTMAATSLTTAKPVYREGYEPFLPGVHVAPYPLPLHEGGAEASTTAALRVLDAMLDSVGGQTVAAMIVEPVLGEGGYVVPPVAWLDGLRARCDELGILLVLDEVQTGMGRTGRCFAAETFGIRPDVLLFAKGVASGLPLGGIAAERALLDRWPTGAHGSTFGGNPVSCAAAVATLDVMEAEGLFDRSAAAGEHARSRLQTATAALAAVAEVRGVGLMIGVELTSKGAAAAVQDACLVAGLIVLRCGPDESILRIVPPLTISDTDLTTGLDILLRALQGL
jgi:4-aminobutyrate aminotransferase